jgi:hypothetical protein
MKKSIRMTVRHAVVCALATLAIASATPPASASPILTITSSAPSVSAGSDFYVNIGIEDVTDLFGFGLVLTIDDLTKATFRGTDSDSGDADNDPTNEGPFLASGFDAITGDPNFTFYYDQYLGSASVYVTNSVVLGSGVSSGGVLFRAFFTAGQNPGPVSIDFGTTTEVNVGLWDSTIDDTGTIPGVITPTDLIGARVDIVAPTATVPEPATVGLVGIGVAALWRRRANKVCPPVPVVD